MAYYIRQLKDNSGNVILPATRAAGVFFDDNTKLQDIISGQTGVVKKALGDKNGKDLTSYIETASIEDHKLTLTKGDGTPVEITIPDKDTTYENATSDTAGLMSAADKAKLDGIDAQLAGKADAEHTHEIADITDLKDMVGASGEAAGAHGLVPAPAQGDQGKFLTGAGTWSSVTLASFGVTASAAELNYMTGVTSGVQAQIDAKLDKTALKIATGDETGIVKGSSEITVGVDGALTVAAIEQTKVTGLTDALAGKAAASHTHEIANVNGLQAALDLKADKSAIPTVMLTIDEDWGGESTELPEFAPAE